MSTVTPTSQTVQLGFASRVLREGYGPGAWHGPDLKAAVSDVSSADAYWRPAAGRHNIAEIALHHAYCVRNVRAQLSGRAVDPFVLEGEDWFDVPDATTLPWPDIQAALDVEQRRLASLAADIEAGTQTCPLGENERLDLAIGITCHAIYHAGQIQLIKRLRGE